MEIEYTWMARDVSGVALYESRPSFSQGYWRCDKSKPLRWCRVNDVLFIEPEQLWECICASNAAAYVERWDYALWGGYWWHLEEDNGIKLTPGMNINIPVAELKRGKVLHRAVKIINGERQEQYGKPEDSFKRIANLWSGYAKAKGWDVEFSPVDVAHLMIEYKLARQIGGAGKEDNYTDMAGYTGLAADMEFNGMENILPRNAEEWGV